MIKHSSMRFINATLLLLAMIPLFTGCGVKSTPAQIQTVTFEQLFTNHEQYNGNNIIIEGFYFDGFEVQVIAERLEYSGYAEGHMIPKGRTIWVG
ncbi:hypothetical protein ACFLTT_03415, partial [Chloroflexota bacterium]